MQTNDPNFKLRLAAEPRDLVAAQRLRYKVFVEELGADGGEVDHEQRLETDAFDTHCDHLILEDTRLDPSDFGNVVGVYRLLRGAQADRVGRFYSESEYDLSVLKSKDLNLLELGRSCVLPEYRGGSAMYHLWSGLTAFSADHHIDVLFGTASFHGTQIDGLKTALSFLHHRHLAPKDLRVRSLSYQNMNLIDEANLDRLQASRSIPALIKAYIRLGGVVGDGAYVDHAFNTTDVCLLIDRQRLSQKHHAIYGGRPV